MPVVPGPATGQVSLLCLGGSADGQCESIVFTVSSSQTSYQPLPKWKPVRSYQQDDHLLQKIGGADLNDL